MDTHSKVIQWAKILEYKGNIPNANTFKSLCNPSTTFIWEQLVAQIKPKQEVQQLRYNNLIVRLQNKQNAEDWNKIQRPIKELELWRRKNKLQQEVKDITESIEEKEKLANNYSKEHKIRGMQRAHIKALIKEAETKTFLLRQKSQALQNDISDAEESLIFFRNLTPIESLGEEPDIGDTLRKCVEKIEKSICEQKLQASAYPNPSLSVTPLKISFTNIFMQSDSSLQTQSKCEDYKKDISEAINCLCDKNISKDVKSLLYNTDTRSILSVILNDIDILKMKLFNAITSTKSLAKPMEENEIYGMMKLQVMQIENELYAMKYMKEVDKLNILLKHKETAISTAFNELNKSDRRELFSLQRKEAGLNAVCNYINAKLANGRTIKNARDELLRIDTNILAMQQKLVDDLRNVNHKYDLYKKMYKTMLLYREETRSLVKKLNQFTNDLTWTLPLTYDLPSKEILLFKEFPLEYNRRITVGDSNLYTRDIINNAPINLEEIDTQTLQMLLLLVECPYSAPETLFYKLWETKTKIKIRKSLCTTVKSFDYKTYTIKELREQECYIDTTIDKLHNLMKKNSGRMSDRDTKMIRETARLWLEIPFSNYVHQDRLYEGNNCVYFQNMFDNLYRQISQ